MEKKTNKKHVPFWKKWVLVLLSAAVFALGAWVYCEKIASPVYSDSQARITLKAEGYNFDTVMRFYGDEGLQILEGLREELESTEYLSRVAAAAGVSAEAVAFRVTG